VLDCCLPVFSDLFPKALDTASIPHTRPWPT